MEKRTTESLPEIRPSEIFKDSLLPPLKIGGIYSIINKSNGKIYIGSSINVRARVNSHKHYFTKQRCHNVYLKRAIRKSPSDFEFSMIEEVKDRNLLLDREQFWMDFYKSYIPENGYNICPKARSCLGAKMSPEACKKLSERKKGVPMHPNARAALKKWHTGRKKGPMPAHVKEALIRSLKGKPQSAEHKKKRLEMWRLAKARLIPIIQLDMDGNEVARFESIVSAERHFGKKFGIKTNIGAVLLNKYGRKSCFGYKWKYA